MKTFTKHIIILTSVCGIISCTPTMTAYFWNGHYSLNKTAKESQKKEKEFYAKETIKQKELRKQNQLICDKIAKQKYPNTTILEGQNGLKRDLLYDECMEKRGSPLFKYK